MRLCPKSCSFIAVLILGLALPVADALAQDANPFGGDPFADPAPAAEAPATAPAGSDPFADTEAAQRPAHAADPFGGKPRRDRIRATVKPALRPAPKVVATDKVHRATAAEDHIREILGQKTSVTLIETPLEEAVRFMSEKHDIPVVVDLRALDEIGLTSDVPITLQLKNVSLRSTLKLMLRNLDLTYVIKNEVLLITTKEAAEGNLVLKTYQFPEELTDRGDKITEVLRSMVQPDQWAELGGPSSVGVIDNVLFISANEEVHEDVDTFMTKLKDAYQRRVAKDSDAKN